MSWGVHLRLTFIVVAKSFSFCNTFFYKTVDKSLSVTFPVQKPLSLTEKLCLANEIQGLPLDF
jgi:hypothetical protein